MQSQSTTCTLPKPTPLENRIRMAGGLQAERENRVYRYLREMATQPVSSYLEGYRPAYVLLHQILFSHNLPTRQSLTVGDVADYGERLHSRFSPDDPGCAIARILAIPMMASADRKNIGDMPSETIGVGTFRYRFLCCGTHMYLRYPQLRMDVVEFFAGADDALPGTELNEYCTSHLYPKLRGQERMSFLGWVNLALKDMSDPSPELREQGSRDVYNTILEPLILWNRDHDMPF